MKRKKIFSEVQVVNIDWKKGAITLFDFRCCENIIYSLVTVKTLKFSVNVYWG